MVIPLVFGRNGPCRAPVSPWERLLTWGRRKISNFTDAGESWSCHDNDMEAMTSPTDNSATYSLWHIPTSTLLVMTNAVAEVMRRIELATTEGVFLAELMLNVDQDGSLVGKCRSRRLACGQTTSGAVHARRASSPRVVCSPITLLPSKIPPPSHGGVFLCGTTPPAHRIKAMAEPAQHAQAIIRRWIVPKCT
jgi:hypothetical protein